MAQPPSLPTRERPYLIQGPFGLSLAFSERQSLVASLIAHLALQLLFPMGVGLVAVAVLPPIFYGALWISAVVSASFLSGFFFQPDSFHRSAVMKVRLPPLLKASVDRTAEIELPQSEALPESAPRGIRNGGNTCWLNALLQVFRADKGALQFVREGGDPFLAPFRAFFEFYEWSRAQGFSLVKAPSELHRGRLIELSANGLRRILAERAPRLGEEDLEREQDASEGLGPLLDCLPDRFKVRIEATRSYLSEELPPMIVTEEMERTGIRIVDGYTRVQEELYSLLQLPLAEEPDLQLERMLYRHYLQGETRGAEEGFRAYGVDGKEHCYRPLSIRRKMVEAPDSLWIHLKRFNYREPSQERAVGSVWDKLSLPDWLWPSTGGGSVKLDLEVSVPSSLQIEGRDGSLHTYQLNAFVQHLGPTVEKGHYKAYFQAEDGQGYCCDDATITPMSRDLWPLSQAFLLHYEKVAPPLPQVPRDRSSASSLAGSG